jgi:hypothetical protein
MGRRNLTAIAYHEAGHAVLMAALGYRVRFALRVGWLRRWRFLSP